MRRAFADCSAYLNEYEYLVGYEPPLQNYNPHPDLRTTTFHRGFMRGRVEGQVEARAAKEQSKVRALH